MGFSINLENSNSSLILIFGSSGFLGSYLLNFLKKKNLELITCGRNSLNDIKIKSYNKKSLSKIKSPCNYDILSIIVKGFKKVSIFDFDENKKSILLFISKNTGLVLSKNTITSENIASGSIILDIISEENTLDIEK